MYGDCVVGVVEVVVGIGQCVNLQVVVEVWNIQVYLCVVLCVEGDWVGEQVDDLYFWVDLCGFGQCVVIYVVVVVQVCGVIVYCFDQVVVEVVGFGGECLFGEYL